MNELTKNSKNSEVIVAMKAAGINMNDNCIIIDIRPTKTAGKSTLFVISEVNIKADTDSKHDIKRMSAFELRAQQFSENTMLRGKVTMLDTVIAENQLVKGSILSMKVGDETLVAKLQVYESHAKFYDTQKPVGFVNVNNVFEAKLRDGKPFYRDTQIVADEPQHQLL